MSTYNRVTIVGNVGADPEARSTTGGGRVCTLSLATSETWTDAKGQKRELTQWHRCVFWNTNTRKLADHVERYVKKGDKVLVEGKIAYRQWQDKDGQTRYTTEINVQMVTFLTPKTTRDARDGDASSVKDVTGATVDYPVQADDLDPLPF